MEKIKLNFVLDPMYHDRAPKAMVTLNDDVLMDETVSETRNVELTLDLEEDENYELGFHLYGKKDEDTIIDDDGNILKDQLLTVRNIAFDGVELDPVLPVNQNCYYYHDGDRRPFLGIMGRNGVSAIRFTSPAYVWLLENL